jgi:predicted trehalose synthase
MEASADRTLAVVLWVKHARNIAVVIVLFAVLNETLRMFLRTLSTDRLNSLSDEQAKGLNAKLQEIHGQLAGMLDHGAMCFLRRQKMFEWFIDQLEERAEDLSDIIEDLALSYNSAFRAIVSDCVKTVSSAQSAETVARV